MSDRQTLVVGPLADHKLQPALVLLYLGLGSRVNLFALLAETDNCSCHDMSWRYPTESTRTRALHPVL